MARRCSISATRASWCCLQTTLEATDRDSVKMEVRSKEGKVYPVIYSMRLGEDGSWRMYNIIINGINIGLTYRNQFASAMNAPENKGSLDAVINGWGETIAHIDPAAGTPESASGEVMVSDSTDLLHHRISGSPTLTNGKEARALLDAAFTEIGASSASSANALSNDSANDSANARRPNLAPSRFRWAA